MEPEHRPNQTQPRGPPTGAIPSQEVPQVAERNYITDDSSSVIPEQTEDEEAEQTKYAGKFQDAPLFNAAPELWLRRYYPDWSEEKILTVLILIENANFVEEYEDHEKEAKDVER